jgi:hypothetical protein
MATMSTAKNATTMSIVNLLRAAYR